ncbi:MAG: flavodoxin family protein [Planctomycetes bacterium]|nr:flavodoxin family protein [Planctomycetota bacterium]
MAKVIGIVGSPKKDGLTGRLVQRALEGAASRGADTEIRYLADMEIKPCAGCAASDCWTGGNCKYQDDAQALQKAIRDSDAIILGAPVYYLDVNGLTKNFMDRMRLGDAACGKRALGITVAGGTGKGLILALKTLYHFFLCTGLRGLSPTPVTRFNFDAGLRMAHKNAAALATPPIETIPFHDLAERIAWTYDLPFMRHDIIDENLYLAKVVVDACRKTDQSAELLARAQSGLMRAAQLVEQGRKQQALDHIMAAYQAGTEAWEMGRNA